MMQLLGSVDVQQVAAVVGGIATFCGAIYAGVRQGLKKVRSEQTDPGARIAGGIIMDNASMALLSERLRENTEAIRDGSREVTATVREATHQIERLRDRLP